MKKKWPIIKEGIFWFLALTKIVDWVGRITEAWHFQALDAEMSMGWALLNRILGQDLQVIFMVVGFMWIDRLKYNFFLKFIIGYIVLSIVLFSYVFGVNWLLGNDPLYFLDWGFFGFYTLGYIVLMGLLYLKKLIRTRSEKKKEAVVTEECTCKNNPATGG
jgi:hypothetical protein